MAGADENTNEHFYIFKNFQFSKIKRILDY